MINEIKHLYPSADPLLDFELRDDSDGRGPYIARWDDTKLGPRPTLAQLSAVAEPARIAAFKVPAIEKVRATRERIIDRLNGIAGRAQRSGDVALATSCDVAVVGLLGITSDASVVAATTDAALKLAIKTRYAAIAAALPAAGRGAFRGIDA